MRLIGSLTSPFVRFVRVTLAELCVEHEFEVTGPFGKTSPEHERIINSANPLMKVPVLDTGDHVIIDSRIIVNWLLRHHSSDGRFGADFPETLARENVLSTIYGVLEAGILRFIIQMSHPEIDMNAAYMARSIERVHSGLSALEHDPDITESFGPPEALLVCGLEWMRKRQVYDWSVHRRLVEIHAQHAERDSLVNTRIPDKI
ncbi:MAG: hypothetical protein HKO64_03090 [Xanthomonadales bacterium]|nr:hypothetical protein [Xanthomonadales bacterium]NNL94583.1 hypothetical protein [Xanthomonadales bacterium]